MPQGSPLMQELVLWSLSLCLRTPSYSQNQTCPETRRLRQQPHAGLGPGCYKAAPVCGHAHQTLPVRDTKWTCSIRLSTESMPQNPESPDLSGLRCQPQVWEGGREEGCHPAAPVCSRPCPMLPVPQRGDTAAVHPKYRSSPSNAQMCRRLTAPAARRSGSGMPQSCASLRPYT